jgi:periplasmic protein CpxP/Spy
MFKRASALIAGGILAAGMLAMAWGRQDSPPAPENSADHSSTNHSLSDHFSLDHSARELAHLTRKLKLSAAQQTEVKGILQDRDKQMEALHADTSLSRGARMVQARSIMDGYAAQIEAVLDDSQRHKFEKAQRAIKARQQNDSNAFQDQGGPPPPDDMGPPPDGGQPPDGGGPGGGGPPGD